jgi:hypothetical protein
MNFKDIENVVKHLQKTCTCLHCQKKFNLKDIHIVATTNIEGIFETKCKKCGFSTIVNVLLSKEAENEVGEKEIASAEIKKIVNGKEKVSPNDILDIKNFLTHFDGNFKKIFENKT